MELLALVLEAALAAFLQDVADRSLLSKEA
jgi:hypothetical protein